METEPILSHNEQREIARRLFNRRQRLQVGTTGIVTLIDRECSGKQTLLAHLSSSVRATPAREDSHIWADQIDTRFALSPALTAPTETIRAAA